MPLAALFDGKQYLVQKHRIALFDSVTNQLKDPPKTKWRRVAFGVSKAHPCFSPLPALEEELNGIIREAPRETGILEGRRLLDSQFTRTSFQRELAMEYQVVHVATHFQFRPADDT